MAPASATKGDARYVPELDGLRALAVLGVVAFHLADIGNGNNTGLLSGGWLGVDAFFTLSGYLITSLLVAEATRCGSLDLRAFWRRRIRRLQPGGLVVIVAILATSPWWAPAGTASSVRSKALASMASFANWHALWAHQPYAASGAPSAFEHFWSLAVEEQFYVLWPLAVLGALTVARRLRRAPSCRATVLALACGGTAASWALLWRYPLQRGYLGTDSRMGSILLGAALAAVLPLGRGRLAGARARRAVAASGAACLAGIGIMWVVVAWPPRAGLVTLLPVHALLVAGVLASVVLAPGAGVALLLRRHPLVAVGRVSYGVYLWHWPLFVLVTPERLGTGVVGADAVRLVLLAVATVTMWVVVETPVRAGRVLPLTRVALPAAVASVLAVLLIASAQIEPTPAWATAKGDLVVSPHAASIPPESARVLLVGDSIPTSLLARGDATGKTLQVGEGYVLAQFGESGVDAASMTITGCPVIDEAVIDAGKPGTWCQEYLRRLLPPAIASFRPTVVVWYSREDGYAVGLPDGKVSDPAASNTAAALLRARYRARIQWFASQGAKVILVSPGPNANGHNGNDRRGNSLRSMTFLDDQLRQVAMSNPASVIGVIELSNLLCPEWRRTGSCPDRMPAGGSYRSGDGVHFEGAGAVAAGNWLVTSVAAMLRAAPR